MLSDMDGDKDLDIILNNSNGTMTIYSNNGNGDFKSALTFSGKPGNIEDIDNDGDMDIIYFENLNNSNLPVIILKNNNGSFSSDTTSINMFCQGESPFFGKLDAGDFDNDGDIDLAAGGVYFRVYDHLLLGSLKIKKNYGSGLFNTSSELCNYLDEIDPPNRNYVSGSAAFNYDGDSDIDFLYYPNFGFKNNGDGTFVSIINSDNPYPISPVIGDYDGDGDLDALGQVINSNYFLYKNNLGTFYKDSTYSLPINSNSISGDFDNDGDIDLVNLSGNSSINLYLNQSSFIYANITAIIQGYYNDFGRLNMRDTVKAYLRNTSLPYSVVDSANSVIDSVNFTGGFLFRNAPSGTYYIALKHRNGLETWSKDGGVALTTGATSNYDFTSSQSQAYGNNLVLKGSKYCVYSGDVNHDRVIDAQDLSLVDNDALNYTTGYVSTDITGNRNVDAADLSIVDNNALNYVSAQIPAGSDLPESGFSKSKDLVNDIPAQFELKDNYPNPFNPTTNIKYNLPVSGFVSLKVFDITGREVANLVNENQKAGRFSVEWNASQFASGTYFYKIVAGDFTQVKRMILVK